MIYIFTLFISFSFFFFFNDTATTEIYTLSLHDALPISASFLPFLASFALAPSPSVSSTALPVLRSFFCCSVIEPSATTIPRSSDWTWAKSNGRADITAHDGGPCIGGAARTTGGIENPRGTNQRNKTPPGAHPQLPGKSRRHITVRSHRSRPSNRHRRSTGAGVGQPPRHDRAMNASSPRSPSQTPNPADLSRCSAMIATNRDADGGERDA